MAEVHVVLNEIPPVTRKEWEERVSLAFEDIESRGILEPTWQWARDSSDLYIDLAVFALDRDKASEAAEKVLRRRLTARAQLSIRELTVEDVRPLESYT